VSEVTLNARVSSAVPFFFGEGGKKKKEGVFSFSMLPTLQSPGSGKREGEVLWLDHRAEHDSFL